MAPSSQAQSRRSPPIVAAMSRRQYSVSLSSRSSFPSSTSSSPSSTTIKRAPFEDVIHHIRTSFASATQKRSNDPNCSPQPGVNLCEKPAEATSNVTWAVVGSVLGFVAATTIIVAYILHLRRKKVHKKEDQNDPFQMSDYGFDEAAVAEAARSKANLFRRSQQSSTTSFSTPSPPNPLERRLSFDESPYAVSAAAGIRSSTAVGGDVIYSDISTPPSAALPVGVGMRGESQLFGVPGIEGMDLGGMPMDRERERERSRSRARSSYSHSPHNGQRRQQQRRSRPSSVQSVPFSPGRMTPPRGPRAAGPGGDGASAASGSGLRSPLTDDASSASVRSSEMLRPPVDGDVDSLAGAVTLGLMPWEKDQHQEKVVVTETTRERDISKGIAEEDDTVNEQPKSNNEIRMVAAETAPTAAPKKEEDGEEKPTASQQETVVEVKKGKDNGEQATRI